MARNIEFRHIEEALSPLQYPITRADAIMALSDVTLVLSDGEADLSELVAATDREEFDSLEDIRSALHNTLPREAVGEPFQSDGDS